MRKGLAIPVGGIIMLSMTLVILYVLTLGSWNETRYVTFRGETLMSISHEVELSRKMTDEGSYFISQRAAYDEGLLGGGFDLWNSQSPTIDQLKTKLVERIDSMLSEGTQNSSYSGRRIEWLSKDLTISNYDQSPCGSSLLDSKCFHLTGTQKFSIIDDSIKTQVNSNVSFDQYVDSSYFRLIKVGREIVENNKYNTLLGDPVTLNQTLSADFPDLKFNLTQSLNRLNVEIIDQSCSSVFDKYCLAPVKSGELDSAHQIIAGTPPRVIPFDYLRLRFTIKTTQPL